MLAQIGAGGAGEPVSGAGLGMDARHGRTPVGRAWAAARPSEVGPARAAFHGEPQGAFC
jgi:hypothetical protein